MKRRVLAAEIAQMECVSVADTGMMTVLSVLLVGTARYAVSSVMLRPAMVMASAGLWAHVNAIKRLLVMTAPRALMASSDPTAMCHAPRLCVATRVSVTEMASACAKETSLGTTALLVLQTPTVLTAASTVMPRSHVVVMVYVGLMVCACVRRRMAVTTAVDALAVSTG